MLILLQQGPHNRVEALSRVLQLVMGLCISGRDGLEGGHHRPLHFVHLCVVSKGETVVVNSLSSPE